MKYLIVGLGNMGADYDHTRHNIGFDVVDELARKYDGKWEHKTLGDLALIKHKGRQIYLLKPSTYMNRSGKAVRHWLQKLKFKDQSNLLVVVDDLNLDFEVVRMKPNGSAGGHNGLKDIEQMLGNNKYARLRIGIGDKFSKGRQVDFVLGKWTKSEEKELPFIIQKSMDMCLGFASAGIARTMNQYNS